MTIDGTDLLTNLRELRDFALWRNEINGEDTELEVDRYENLIDITRAATSRDLDDLAELDSSSCLWDNSEDLGLRTIAATLDDVRGSFKEEREDIVRTYGVTEFGEIWLTSEGDDALETAAERTRSKILKAVDAQVDELGTIARVTVEPNVSAIEETIRSLAAAASVIDTVVRELDR